MQEAKATYHVHKFGGTSLANAERFRSLKKILTGNNEIIVVSATQGTTTLLQEVLDLAKNNLPFVAHLTRLEESHRTLAEALLSSRQLSETKALLTKDFSAIKDILHAVQLTGSYAKSMQDLILGYGELWSAKILAYYLSEKEMVNALDASQVLFIYEKHGVICIDWQKSQEALNTYLNGQHFQQIVVTGFIASTLDGHRTILGRNGSDFSAAIFAKLFAAKNVTIWTDVDGIYSADPNRVRSAFVIESLSYKEALELAYFGAKVLHPMTIAPALECQIPIVIKNSLNPSAKGTEICAHPKPSPHVIKGLSCIDDVALINIEGTGMIGVSGIAARVFQILHHEQISVILISQASSEHSICFAVSATNAEAAIASLSENLEFEVDKQHIEKIYADTNCVILSAVGDNMVGTVGISSKLCAALASSNINIKALSQGSSERNISVVIKKDDANKALRAVHAGFYLSRETISIGLIGPGQVGNTLLKQIQIALLHLKSATSVNLQVRGIMNSKSMLLSHDAIDLNEWPQLMKRGGIAADIEAFADHINSDNVPHAVIIDCTANKTIGMHYLDIMQKGIHVITPNKHANAGDLAYYRQLKTLSQKKNHHYLYEATVCAGLPVIHTLQDLIKTGDHIETIEGVVSGTLSFLFCELAKGRKFSDVVFEAKLLGYTEPDPREDLSGMDVARKIICLAREVGYSVTMSDLQVVNLVPTELQNVTLEEFMEELPRFDAAMSERVAAAKAKNERLCYIGTISQSGKVTVALETIADNHPFSRLKGTDNMIVFHTARYHEQPLVIQGPGAGAEVTAAGIFADLLRLADYLS